MSRPEDYDIVIVGGGIAGAAMACGLGNLSWRVAWLEQGTLPGPLPSRAPTDYDLRVSAINLAVQQMLEFLGVWSELEAYRCSAVRSIEVCDHDNRAQIQFNHLEIGQPQLAWIVENRALVSVLVKEVKRFENIDLYEGTALQQLYQGRDSIALQLDSKRWLRARLLIAADGMNSRVRSLAAIPCQGWPYRQTAIVATVGCEHPRLSTAWQCFRHSGPLALLPLTGGRCSIVWSVDDPGAQPLLALDDEGFIAVLQEATGGYFGALELLSERRGFPLYRRQAAAYWAGRVVLIGDAAHRTHPLAGLGANLGLLDVGSLLQLLQEQLGRGRQDPANPLTLLRYQRWRMTENGKLLWAIDSLKRLFSSRFPGIDGLRSMGLIGFGHCPPARTYALRQATGLAGELPRCARV